MDGTAGGLTGLSVAEEGLDASGGSVGDVIGAHGGHIHVALDLDFHFLRLLQKDGTVEHGLGALLFVGVAVFDGDLLVALQTQRQGKGIDLPEDGKCAQDHGGHHRHSGEGQLDRCPLAGFLFLLTHIVSPWEGVFIAYVNSL